MLALATLGVAELLELWVGSDHATTHPGHQQTQG